jgi:membrane protease YdiL (CAAX protease family)
MAIVIMPGPTGQAIYMLCKVWLLLLPLLWRMFIERQPLTLSPARKGGFAIAAALGLGISAIIIGSYGAFGRKLIDPQMIQQAVTPNGLDQQGRYLMLAVYLTLINSLMEEYVWRWFVFKKFEELFGASRKVGRIAVFASAIGFTIHHTITLRGQFDWSITLIGSLGVFIGGAVWSWLYLRYRSIWPGFLSHAIVDAAVFLVGWWIIFG